MESQKRSASGRPAPYGQACVGCVKAKCRCVYRGDGSCERCSRRGVECEHSEGVRKRATRKTGVANRTSKLEERLNDLAELIRLQQQNTSGTGPARPPADSTLGLHGPAAATLSPAQTAKDGTASYLTPSTGPSPNSVQTACDDDMTPLEKEQILERFKKDYLSHFPFMLIKPEVTAEEIQNTRPFLWLNIRAATEKSVAKMNQLGDRIREELARKVLVELERDLEPILGIMILLGWFVLLSTYQTRGKGFQLRYANLANSLVQDLRLDHPYVSSTPCFAHLKAPTQAPMQTNEQRRIVIGMFIISSTISNFLRIDATRWTNNMDDCLRKLAAAPEYEGDELLVSMAQVKLIVEDIGRVSWKRPDYETSGPPYLFLKPLREKLDEIKRTLPPSVADNKTMLSHIYNAEVLLYEMVICYPSAIAVPAYQPPSNTFPNSIPLPAMNILPSESSAAASTGANAIFKPVDIPRLEVLRSCLDAIKRSLDVFFYYPPAKYVGLPFAFMCHLSHTVQMLYRLSMLEEPGWDRTAVRREVDVTSVLHRTADLLGSVADAAGLVSGRSCTDVDIFTRGAATMRSTASLWGSALTQSLGGGGAGGNGAGSGGGGGGVGDNVTSTTAAPLAAGGGTGGVTEVEVLDNMPTLFDFDSDPWLTDLFASWES